MTDVFERRRLAPRGWPGAANVIAWTVAQETLAVVSHDERLLVWSDLAEAPIEPAHHLPWRPQRVVLSPSGRWIAASGAGVPWVVLDVHGAQPPRLLGAGRISPWSHDGVDAFLLKADDHVQLTACGDGAVLFRAAQREKLAIMSMLPVGDGRSAVVVAYEPQVGLDSLYLYRVGEELPGERVDRTDYVNGGPCDASTFVCYRQSVDRENDEDDSEELRASPLYGYDGFYVRAIDGSLTGERLPGAVDVLSEYSISATVQCILVATTKKTLAAVSRRTGQWEDLGPFACMDLLSTRAVLVNAAGDVELITGL